MFKDISIGAPQTRSPQPAAGAEDLFEVFETAFTHFLDSQNVPVVDRPKLVQEYPRTREGKFDTTFDIILIGIESSMMSKDHRLGARPRPNYEEHPTKAGYKLETYGWWEDLAVKFEVISKSSVSANKLVQLFHRKFMIPYSCLFKYFDARGIKNLTLMERRADYINKTDYSEELSVRPLVYSMRVEYLETGEIKTLDRYTVNTHQTVG